METEPEVKTEEAEEAVAVEDAKKTKAGILALTRKASGKVAETVEKTVKKIDIKKSTSAVVSGFKYPVNTVSSIDRQVTESIEKVVQFGDKGVGDNIISQKIKNFDVLITKSVKKLMDSIFKSS